MQQINQVTIDPSVTAKFITWQAAKNGVIFYNDPVTGGMDAAAITADTLASVMEKLQGKNLYYSVNHTTTRAKKASDADIDQVLFVYCDVDPPKELEGLPSNKMLDEMFTRLDDGRPSDIPEPSAVIQTGRGFQALWRLAAPVGPDQFDKVRSVTRTLINRLSADKGVHDVSRVLRLPGSINWGSKSQKKGLYQVLTQTIWLNDNSYTLDQFPAESTKTAPNAKDTGPEIKYEVTDAPETVTDLSQLRTANGKDVWLDVKYLISMGAPGQMTPDHAAEYERSYGENDTKERGNRSLYVMHVCCALVRLGVPDSQILGLITDSKWGISAHVLDQPEARQADYAVRQVRRAHERVSTDQKPVTAPVPVAPKPVLDLKTEVDWLIGASKKVKKAIEVWIHTGELEEEQAVINWIVDRFPAEAEAIVIKNFGDKYKVCLPKTSSTVLPGKDLPRLVATALEKLPTTWSCDEELYVFERNKYRLCNAPEYHTMITQSLQGYEVNSLDDNPKVGLYMSHYKEITNSVIRMKDAPRSTDEVVLFRNGYLKDDKFSPADPHLHVTGGPDCDYDPSAKCPQWIKFLEAQWKDDSASIDLLQELMGLYLVNDVSFHVATVLCGPSRSGKGVIIRTIQKLIGEEFFAAFSVNGIGGSFGLQGLLGKTVAAAADIRGPFDQKARSIAREVILGIAGGDVMDINRKGKPILSAQLHTRMIMSFNEIEDARTLLMDGKGATANRLRVLKTTKSFAGVEDKDLEKKLATELPGIALWAIQGLERLRHQGFTLNHATEVLRLSTKSTQVSDFVEEKVEENTFPAITTEIHNTYKAWAEDNGHKILNSNWFSVQLLDSVEGLLRTDNAVTCNDGKRRRFFYKAGQEEQLAACVPEQSFPEDKRSHSRSN